MALTPKFKWCSLRVLYCNKFNNKSLNLFSGSCQQEVPDGLIETSPNWPKVDQPIFISPWNNNNVELKPVDALNVEKSRTPTHSSIHPFARRTKSRYCVEQKKLFSSSSTDSSEVQNDVWDDSFDEIIRTANRSIETAESILTTLRRGEEIEKTTQTHDTQISPVSDIETNIRRLEKAQDEINAALANFRSVKALNGSAIGSGAMESKLEHKGPPPPPPRPTLKVLSIVAKRKEQFESQKKKSTLSHSTTLPNSEETLEDFVDGNSDQTQTTHLNGKIQ